MSADPSGDPRVAAYGTWPSPLSAAKLAAGAVRIAGVARRNGETWWTELRPSEAGRVVLVRRRPGEEAADVVGAPLSVRTRVHEYGGGAWWLGADAVYLTNWSDQRLYRLGLDGGNNADGTAPVPLTPEPPEPGSLRYADGREHPDGSWLVCVRERHDGPSADQVVNELVVMPADPTGGAEVTVVAGGTDFVAAPRFSPDGRWLSWIRWNHPQMPWDGTELCVAPVTIDPASGPSLGPTEVVTGGTEESIQGPDWTADGRLVFSTDRSGFWNLQAWTPPAGPIETLTSYDGAEIGGPQWVFGLQRWAELPDGRLVVAVTEEATDRLEIIDPAAGTTAAPVAIETPFVAVEDVIATEAGTIVVHGATATSLPELTELSLDGDVTAHHRPPDDIGVDAGWFSRARSYRFQSGDRQAQAFVYEPTAPGLVGPDGDRPPLVVMGHGGPTGHSSPALNLRAQYWTSRGFAVADVNYGGSSGFGRAYRRLLDDRWGEVDVEDCVAVATQLAGDGVVDVDRMAIRGGSAGGYTVLTALARTDVFSAGTNLFGVADLEALARDTHKFESRYLDGLIGPYPEQRQIYLDRSPINHTEGFSCPLLVLQGLEDEIVPPNQSEAIVAAVAAKGLPHAYVAFEGEQHGFRLEANIIRSYELELWFYGRVFGFEPADAIVAPEGAVGL